MNPTSPYDEYQLANELYQRELTKLRNLPKNADVDTEVIPMLDMLGTAHGRMERAKRRAFGSPVKHSKPGKRFT